jgi:hypothetical protein
MLNTKYYGEENTLAGSTLTDEQLDAVAGGQAQCTDLGPVSVCLTPGGPAQVCFESETLQQSICLPL